MPNRAADLFGASVRHTDHGLIVTDHVHRVVQAVAQDGATCTLVAEAPTPEGVSVEEALVEWLQDYARGGPCAVSTADHNDPHTRDLTPLQRRQAARSAADFARSVVSGDYWRS
jgi:hypothetical protein